MKSKIVAVLITLMFFAGTTWAQEQVKSKQQKAPAKTEKSSEMSKSSSEPCCPEMKSGACCDQMSKKGGKTEQTKASTKEAALVYTCPMHPDIRSEKPGKCPKCGMDLVVKK